jgi:Transcriptional activator TraM
MNEEIDELIKEIAVKHNIAVGRDDPIIILQTINNRLMLDSQKAQQEMLDQFKSELEAMSLRWSIDAKEKAERILNASLAASKDAMGQVMLEEAKVTATSVRAEIDDALSHVTINIRDARRISIFNVIASCITMLAAAVALLVILR